MKRLTWMRITGCLQLLVGALFGYISFSPYVANNSTEVRLIDLLTSYRFEVGMGYSPTLINIVTALLGCLILLCLFAGAVNLLFSFNSIPKKAWEGFMLIQLVVFGCGLILMVVFTFLIPILLICSIFISLFLTRYVTREEFTLA